MDEMNLTHVVLKKSDIEKYCGENSKMALSFAALEVSTGRAIDGKDPVPQYIVVNTDEPYIEEIIEVLERYGHWGKSGIYES